MSRILFAFCVIFSFQSISAATAQERLFTGSPVYETTEAKRLVEKMIEAHGGLDPWREVSTFQAKILTKVYGGAQPQYPFYSIETVNMENGTSYIDWPEFGAEIVWDGERVWSRDWPLAGLTPGFFARLDTGFAFLPWITQSDGVIIRRLEDANLPEVVADLEFEGLVDETLYHVFHLEFDAPNPAIPGEFYEYYVDPETFQLKALRFNITHPGLALNPDQPLGPNVHLFIEQAKIGALTFPTYYVSKGQGAESGANTTAIHVVYGVKFNEPLDSSRFVLEEGDVIDDVTTNWWQSK